MSAQSDESGANSLDENVTATSINKRAAPISPAVNTCASRNESEVDNLSFSDGIEFNISDADADETIAASAPQSAPKKSTRKTASKGNKTKSKAAKQIVRDDTDSNTDSDGENHPKPHRQKAPAKKKPKVRFIVVIIFAE